ncbi:hypothetical protein HK096_000025 [Nowakowskiella sp. JEL0078]|nr:hypothetical protein HK096_000025 [Nowakowskiella sp. JEL0078]
MSVQLLTSPPSAQFSALSFEHSSSHPTANATFNSVSLASIVTQKSQNQFFPSSESTKLHSKNDSIIAPLPRKTLSVLAGQSTSCIQNDMPRLGGASPGPKNFKQFVSSQNMDGRAILANIFPAPFCSDDKRNNYTNDLWTLDEDSDMRSEFESQEEEENMNACVELFEIIGSGRHHNPLSQPFFRRRKSSVPHLFPGMPQQTSNNAEETLYHENLNFEPPKLSKTPFRPNKFMGRPIQISCGNHEHFQDELAGSPVSRTLNPIPSNNHFANSHFGTSGYLKKSPSTALLAGISFSSDIESDETESDDGEAFIGILAPSPPPFRPPSSGTSNISPLNWSVASFDAAQIRAKRMRSKSVPNGALDPARAFNF